MRITGARVMIDSFRPRRGLPRFGQDESGNILMITAILLPVLVGCVGLGLDVGLWLYKHQKMQSAADSAAVSAVTGNASNPVTEAKAVTATYGFVDGFDGVVVTVNQPPISGKIGRASCRERM